MSDKLLYKEESFIIQGAFFRVYETFRNSQKENVCHNALIEDLKQAGLKVEKNKRIEIYYNGKKVGTYVPDLIVNEIILIELKCKPFIHKDDQKQFWYYLKNSKYKVGYLVNFGKPNGVEFIRRVYDTARIV
ncbi:MAG: GxxExxY protein [Parcubacteria group bacterium]